jgi:hypothetical protein
MNFKKCLLKAALELTFLVFAYVPPLRLWALACRNWVASKSSPLDYSDWVYSLGLKYLNRKG